MNRIALQCAGACTIRRLSRSRIVWQYAFGIADRRTAAAVDRDTLWVAASLGKPVFAFAALRLADEGKLDLDRPLKTNAPDHLPDDEQANRITARQVLSLTMTGIEHPAFLWL